MHTDRVVVVTGGASGIGLGITKRFARAGHPVAMLDVQDELLERESAALRQEGFNVTPYKVDVTSRQQIDDAYDKIREELGPIAILIANAGISGPAPFATMSIELWNKMLEVNLTGTFHCMQAALPDMLAKKWGRIVTISSQAGQGGAPFRVHYSASKGGVIGLTKGLALEVANEGITVNTVPPSLVDTPLSRGEEAAGTNAPIDAIAKMVPISRAGTPDDIAAACEFLASEGASYITAQEINVNGGMRR